MRATLSEDTSLTPDRGVWYQVYAALSSVACLTEKYHGLHLDIAELQQATTLVFSTTYGRFLT